MHYMHKNLRSAYRSIKKIHTLSVDLRRIVRTRNPNAKNGIESVFTDFELNFAPSQGYIYEYP